MLILKSTTPTTPSLPTFFNHSINYINNTNNPCLLTLHHLLWVITFQGHKHCTGLSKAFDPPPLKKKIYMQAKYKHCTSIDKKLQAKLRLCTEVLTDKTDRSKSVSPWEFHLWV